MHPLDPLRATTKRRWHMASAARTSALHEKVFAPTRHLLLRFRAPWRQHMASVTGTLYPTPRAMVSVEELSEAKLGGNFSCARAARFRPLRELGELFLNVGGRASQQKRHGWRAEQEEVFKPCRTG